MIYFEVSLKLGVMSFIYVRLYNDGLFFLLVLIHTYNNNKVGSITLEDLKNIPSGLVSFSIDTMSFSIALGVEQLGRSISVIMCIQLKKPIQTPAYNIFVRFSNFMTCFGAGFSVTSRTEINKCIGMKETKKAKNVFYTYIVGLVIVSYMLGIC